MQNVSCSLPTGETSYLPNLCGDRKVFSVWRLDGKKRNTTCNLKQFFFGQTRLADAKKTVQNCVTFCPIKLSTGQLFAAVDRNSNRFLTKKMNRKQFQRWTEFWADIKNMNNWLVLKFLRNEGQESEQILNWQNLIDSEIFAAVDWTQSGFLHWKIKWMKHFFSNEMETELIFNRKYFSALT